MRGSRLRWTCLVGMVLLVALVSGCAASTDGGEKASADTVAFIDNAMPKLAKVMDKWNNGSYDGAATLWKSIGDVPLVTAADKVLTDDYLEYANNVRYFMVGDGSATMKDVEDSRTNAETTLAALRP